VNPSKVKGTRFESLVVEFLRAHGFPMAERRALRGNKDCGDVLGIPGYVCEAKATKAIDLAGAMDEARQEAVNASCGRYVAIVKRRNRPVAQAYVVMTLAQFCETVSD
jgi:hypothetical protein